MKSNRTIVYVNFSQYDNTGRILDYLRETFATVIHFSFDHLRLKHGRKTNLLTIYRQGQKVKQIKLYSLRVSSPFLFPSLPLVGIIMGLQILRHTFYLKSQLSSAIFFTVNAYPALVGIILKKLKLVGEVRYWVWDFYPLAYPDWRLRLIRYCYLLFDTIAIHFSDKLIFPNRRQLTIRNRIKAIRNQVTIIPLGSSKPIAYQPKKSYIVGFMGMLKASQGIELLLENLEAILSINPAIRVEIIGSGPDEEFWRHKAKKYQERVKFCGFVEDQNQIDRLVRRWFAGLAVYKPDQSNESYFGDPSKIKVYLSQGVPIITTEVTEYGQLAQKHQFGLVIPYSPPRLIRAIAGLFRRQVFYRQRALAFAQKLYYKTLYRGMFA